MKKIMDHVKSTCSGIVISFALAFMLCIYAPFELYLTNQSEFWFDAVMMLKPAALLFALIFVGCVAAFLIIRLLGKTPYDIALALSFAALGVDTISGTTTPAPISPSLELAPSATGPGSSSFGIGGSAPGERSSIFDDIPGPIPGGIPGPIPGGIPGGKVSFGRYVCHLEEQIAFKCRDVCC